MLTIGGTGQPGHFVLQHLANAGHSLMAAGIGRAPEAGFLPRETESLVRDTDACSVPDLVDLLRGVDTLIHAAGDRRLPSRLRGADPGLVRNAILAAHQRNAVVPKPSAGTSTITKTKTVTSDK